MSEFILYMAEMALCANCPGGLLKNRVNKYSVILLMVIDTTFMVVDAFVVYLILSKRSEGLEQGSFSWLLPLGLTATTFVVMIGQFLLVYV
ncbi:hypothetical protein B0H10DRAFT_1993774, partial [Mycena sp. CBHHK59/15]